MNWIYSCADSLTRIITLRFGLNIIQNFRYNVVLKLGPVGQTGQNPSNSGSIINAVRNTLKTGNESPLMFPSCDCLDGFQPIPEPLR